MSECFVAGHQRCISLESSSRNGEKRVLTTTSVSTFILLAVMQEIPIIFPENNASKREKARGLPLISSLFQF